MRLRFAGLASRSRPLAALLAAGLLGLLAEAVPAADYFVDNVMGDDHEDGRAPAQAIDASGPVRTLTRALQLAGPGDRILLTPTGVPYRESVTLEGPRHSGGELTPFEIDGQGAILDGAVPVPDAAWEHEGGSVFRFAPRLKAHQQLFFNGLPLERVFSAAEGASPKLRPLQWCLFQRNVYFRVEPGRLPQDYGLWCTGGPTVGLTLYEVRNVVIRNLAVQSFQLDGINAHDKAWEVRLEGVLARGNGRSGFSVGGCSRVSLEGCTAGSNGAAQLRTEGLSQTRLAGCQLIPAPRAPGLVREGGVVEEVGAAPAGAGGPAGPP